MIKPQYIETTRNEVSLPLSEITRWLYAIMLPKIGAKDNPMNIEDTMLKYT